MTPRQRKADAVFQEVPGYPDLELDTRSGVYYVRKSIAGKGEIFRSTRCKGVKKAKTVAEEIIAEVRGRKPGMRGGRIRMLDLCPLVLADLKKMTETMDSAGQPLRRLSTYESKDLPFLRGKELRIAAKRKNTRAMGVIPDLFGEYFADEIDEQFFKTWVKREGRALGRGLGDIAKYLSLVLSYAYDEKYLARKPTFKNPDQHRRKAIVYADEQVLAFFNSAEPTLRDLVIVGSENPLRPHENREVQWSMVTISREQDGPVVEYDLPEWFVKKNARRIRLTPNAAKVVLRRFQENEALPLSRRSNYVFPAPKDPKKPLSKKTMNRMWHRMKERAGIPETTKVQFHWFRHNVYRRLLKLHGIPIASVSQVGGTSVATLQKHYELEEEQAKVQVAQAISLPFHQETNK